MTVEEFIGTLESSDRLRIIEEKAEVYVGYLAAFKPFADHEISEEYRKYSEHEVKKFTPLRLIRRICCMNLRTAQRFTKE